jgi:hypothetical protein
MNDVARDGGQLVVAHHHPGRLRVRSRAFALDEALRESTGRWLAEQSGVLDVRVHPDTGSILIAYDFAHADAGDLLTAVAERARLSIVEPKASTQALLDLTRDLDNSLFESSGGRFGLGVALPLAMAIGSVGSFFWSAHLRTPRWDNLIYWGVQVLRMRGERDAHRRRHASSP